MSINVVILAGGSGSRVGTDIPKQFLELNGKPVIIRTLTQFDNNKNIDSIFVVCNPRYVPLLKTMLENFPILKIRAILPGGKNSHESLINGLSALKSSAKNDDYVIIHEAVRPFVSNIDIDNLISNAKRNGCSCTATKCYETLMTKDQNGVALREINREQVARIMMPQMYKFDDIWNAIMNSINDGKIFVSANTMMVYYGYKIYLSECSILNIKITTMDDFIISSAIAELLDKQKC